MPYSALNLNYSSLIKLKGVVVVCCLGRYFDVCWYVSSCLHLFSRCSCCVRISLRCSLRVNFLEHVLHDVLFTVGCLQFYSKPSSFCRLHAFILRSFILFIFRYYRLVYGPLPLSKTGCSKFVAGNSLRLVE